MYFNSTKLKDALKKRITQKPFILSLVAFMVGASIFVYGITKAASPTDCDSNAIVKCGVYNINVMADWYGRNLQKTRDVFNHYGINDQWSDLQSGYVTKTGDVFVGNQKVATGAISVGRQNITGSTAVNIAGSTFYQRPTSVSFGISSIPAYVKLVNGEFKWAVLKSCGNPVIGNPVIQPKPDYAIQKKVIQNSSDSTDRAFFFGSENIQATQGSQVRFVSMISNTNKIAGTVLAYDELPAGVNYVQGTFLIKDGSGSIIQTGNLGNISGSSFGVNANIPAGGEIKLDIVATYNSSSEIRNIACVIPSGDQNAKKCDDATVTPPPVTPPPVEPSYSCTNLTVDKLTNNSYKFTASGSVSGGAVISGYIFKVNDQEVYNAEASNFTYNQTIPGQYTIKAYLKTNKGITPEVAACTKTISVAINPEPSYTIKKYVNTRDAQDNESSVVVQPNIPFEYKVELKNTGNVELKDVKIWDLLPANVEYIDNTLKQDGNTLVNDSPFFSTGIVIPTLAKDQTINFTFQAIIKAETDEKKAQMCESSNGGTFYNNIAKADPASAPGVDNNNPNLEQKEDPAVVKCSFILPVKHPSVIVEKEVSSYQVTVGGQFAWMITVTNNGDMDLKNVVVNDTAPKNTEFLKTADLAGTTIELNSKSFKATIAELKIGQKVTFTITAKLTDYQASDVVNTACDNAPEVNPNQPSKDDDCDDAKVKPIKEKCTVPGMETKDKDDPTCKPMCKVKGKENLYADDKSCQDPDCVTVNGQVISTKGKDSCQNPTVVSMPGATPSTGFDAIIALGVTISLSALAYMSTLHISKKHREIKQD